MATYVIGDLQGCFDPLKALLAKINYQPEQDQLWFVGDLVNRGPQSLECLRFVKATCEAGRGKTVLGNHDFHLLGAYCGLEKYQSKSDTLQPILQAEDVDDLIDWLRHQPLLVEHDYLPVIMVHAGLPPQWDLTTAKHEAESIQQILQGPAWRAAIRHHLFGSEPREWSPVLEGWQRIRYSLNALVRMRYCNSEGKLEFKQKMSPENAGKKKYAPWFTHPNRKNKDVEICFGHWSTLGAIDAYRIHATDTGCLWGGSLSAYCLETQRRHIIDCTAMAQVHSS